MSVSSNRPAPLRAVLLSLLPFLFLALVAPLISSPAAAKGVDLRRYQLVAEITLGNKKQVLEIGSCRRQGFDVCEISKYNASAEKRDYAVRYGKQAELQIALGSCGEETDRYVDVFVKLSAKKSNHMGDGSKIVMSTRLITLVGEDKSTSVLHNLITTRNHGAQVQTVPVSALLGEEGVWEIYTDCDKKTEGEVAWKLLPLKR